MLELPENARQSRGEIDPNDAMALRRVAKQAVCQYMFQKAIAEEDGYRVRWGKMPGKNDQGKVNWVGLIQIGEEPPGAGLLVCEGSQEAPNLDGPVLKYDYMEWWAFREGVKDGEFNFDNPSPLGQIAILTSTGSVPPFESDPKPGPTVRILSGGSASY